MSSPGAAAAATSGVTRAMNRRRAAVRARWAASPAVSPRVPEWYVRRGRVAHVVRRSVRFRHGHGSNARQRAAVAAIDDRGVGVDENHEGGPSPWNASVLHGRLRSGQRIQMITAAGLRGVIGGRSAARR